MILHLKRINHLFLCRSSSIFAPLTTASPTSWHKSERNETKNYHQPCGGVIDFSHHTHGRYGSKWLNGKNQREEDALLSDKHHPSIRLKSFFFLLREAFRTISPRKFTPPSRMRSVLWIRLASVYLCFFLCWIAFFAL